jgi:hypothetical protein
VGIRAPNSRCVLQFAAGYRTIIGKNNSRSMGVAKANSVRWLSAKVTRRLVVSIAQPAHGRSGSQPVSFQKYRFSLLGSPMSVACRSAESYLIVIVKLLLKIVIGKPLAPNARSVNARPAQRKLAGLRPGTGCSVYEMVVVLKTAPGGKVTVILPLVAVRSASYTVSR